jgi:hypothetical protein
MQSSFQIRRPLRCLEPDMPLGYNAGRWALLDVLRQTEGPRDALPAFAIQRASPAFLNLRRKTLLTS